MNKALTANAQIEDKGSGLPRASRLRSSLSTLAAGEIETGSNPDRGPRGRGKGFWIRVDTYVCSPPPGCRGIGADLTLIVRVPADERILGRALLCMLAVLHPAVMVSELA